MTKLINTFNYLRILRNSKVIFSTRSYLLPISTQTSSACHSHSFPSILTKKLFYEPSKSIQPIRYMGGKPTELVEIEDRVMYNLRLYDKIDQNKLALGAHFIKDLGLDSLDHVEVIMQVENEFGHHIPDVHAAKLLTPQELIDYLADQLDIFD